jgi:hypothetical protein
MKSVLFADLIMLCSFCKIKMFFFFFLISIDYLSYCKSTVCVFRFCFTIQCLLWNYIYCELFKVERWWEILLPKVAPLLYENGGPIIMVQVCRFITL